MFKQSPRRAKNKGIKVKHVVQVGLLLGVGIWLLYQVQHSRDNKESVEESANTSEKIQTGNDMIKLGRKDLQPDLKDTTVEDERNKEENAAEKKQFEEENKPGEHAHDEVKGEGEGQNREDSVNGQKETEDSSEKEVREEENKEGERGEESEGGKEKEAEEKENDDSKSAEENGTKEEEGVKSEREQSGEKDGEGKEKGSSEKETEEIDAGGEEKENNENVVEDTKGKESEEGHVEVKDNKEEEASKKREIEETRENEIAETKENGGEETKENGSELDGGEEKEVKEDKTEENEKEDGEKNGEVGDKGSDSKQKEEKEEDASDVLSTAIKESENTTETAGGTASNKDAREGENLEKMFSNVVANKGRRNVTYQEETGDNSNFTTGTIEGNQKQAEDTIYSSVTNGDGSQNVVKEPSENVYEKPDSDSAPPSMVQNNTTNQESVDEQNVDFSASGTTENGSENSSGSEDNHMAEQKDSNYSGTVAAEQFKPSHDSDKPDAGQSKPEYSSHTEEASSVSHDQADAGKQNQDASSGSSLLQEEKEARTDLGTLPETGTEGNSNEEVAAE